MSHARGRKRYDEEEGESSGKSTVVLVSQVKSKGRAR